MRLRRAKEDGAAGLSNWHWMAIVILTFLASFVVGQFLPGWANSAGGVLGKGKVPDTPLIRILSFLVLFLVVVGIELVLWIRSASRQTIRDVNETVASGIALHGRDVAETSALRSLLPHQATTPEAAAEAGRLVKRFGDLLGGVPSGLAAGYSIVLEGLLAGVVTRELDAVGRTGVEVHVGRHVAIAKALAAGGSSFTQINRGAYDVWDEWTDVWRALVREFGARRWSAAPPEYVVLMPAAELDRNEAKLRAMDAFFQDAGWSMRCCELEAVQDAIGEKLPTDAIAIDVYSDLTAKLLWLPPGQRFSGAIKVRIQLVELWKHPEITELVKEVRASAHLPKWAASVDGHRLRDYARRFRGARH